MGFRSSYHYSWAYRAQLSIFPDFLSFSLAYLSLAHHSYWVMYIFVCPYDWCSYEFSYPLLGLVPLNPIVWCYVCYYVWHNVVINKVSLVLSKIMVTWIFGHYHIVYKMHSMWFMWFSHRRYRSQVLCKLIILVRSWWWNWAFHLRRL